MSKFDNEDELPIIVSVAAEVSQCSKCDGACQCGKTHMYKQAPARSGYMQPCPPNKQSGCCDEKPHGYMPLPMAPRPNTAPIMLCAKTANEFNFPEIGFTADVSLPGVILAEGQPLSYEDSKGEKCTLHVALVVSEATGEYKLENRASSGNPEDKIGKPVFCGTKLFLAGSSQILTVSDKVCNSLTSDFHIPSVGQSSPAEVDSFSGFETGNQAIIRNKLNPTVAYIFEVISFSGTNKIILKNIGDESGEAGETLTALDCDDYLWCVEATDPATICEQATETQTIFHILGCDKDGNVIKIRGTNTNEALLFDNANPEDCGYKNKIVEQTAVCRGLNSCFQLPIYSEPCNRPMIFIETTDDAFILSQLEESLLSVIAHPILTICGYEFNVLLAESEVGAIKIVPTFENPDAVIKFDDTCDVCIPENCCDQCNPQIAYPIDELSPASEPSIDGTTYGSGLNIGYGMVIPPGAVPAAGQYRFQVVRFPDQSPEYLTIAFNDFGIPTAAYNPDGSTATLPADYDPMTAGFYYTEWCNGGKCPIKGTLKEDLICPHPDMQDGFCVARNQYAVMRVDNCIWPQDIPRITQYNIPLFLKDGREKIQLAVNGFLEGWVTGSPGQQPLQNYSGYQERSLIADVGDCIEIRIQSNYLVVADAAATGPITVGCASTILFETEVL